MDTRARELAVAGPAQALLATHAAVSLAVHMCSQDPPFLCYQGPEGSIPTPRSSAPQAPSKVEELSEDLLYNGVNPVDRAPNQGSLSQKRGGQQSPQGLGWTLVLGQWYPAQRPPLVLGGQLGPGHAHQLGAP